MDENKLNSDTVNLEKGKPWSIAKQNERVSEKDEWMPTYNDVVEMITNIEFMDDRALVAVAYLTAGRIDEIVKSLMKKDITFETYVGVECMVFRMLNLKNRKWHMKILPVPIDKEKELVQIVKDYMDGLPYPDSLLFDYSRITAWKKMRRICNCTNHWWRHIRLTHLKKYHNYDDQKLMKYAGWTDTRPAERYTHYKVEDLVY